MNTLSYLEAGGNWKCTEGSRSRNGFEEAALGEGMQ
jgi:hypothetical protein